MDMIKTMLSGNKQELLMGMIAVQGALTFAFVICSFAVSATANAGFNIVLTGFLNIALVAGSYYVLKKSKAPIAVRFAMIHILYLLLIDPSIHSMAFS